MRQLMEFHDRYQTAAYSEADLVHGIKIAMGFKTDQPIPQNCFCKVEQILKLLRTVEREMFARGELSIQNRIKTLLGV